MPPTGAKRGIDSGEEDRGDENSLTEELEKAGAEMISGARVTAISGKEVNVQGDTIVLAVGAKPENRLYEELRNRLVNLHIIGDAKEPKQILYAVSEGFHAAYYL